MRITASFHTLSGWMQTLLIHHHKKPSPAQPEAPQGTRFLSNTRSSWQPGWYCASAWPQSLGQHLQARE